MSESKLIAAIEHRFSSRDLAGARRLIPQLIPFCKNSLKTRIRAADFLLRIPEPAKAFRLLSDHVHLNAESRLLLAVAANFLGASGYGLRMLATVPEGTRNRRRVETGQLLATTYNDVEALRYFSNTGTPVDPKPESGEMGEKALLFRCYSLIELECYDEVLAISEYFLKDRSSLHQKAFAMIFAAWACVDRNDFRAANSYLDRFEAFTGQEGTWPDTLYHHVAGMYAARKRRYRQALAHFDVAWEKSFQPGLQPEASWLQVLYWRGWIGFTRTSKFPPEWARLYVYPSVTNVYRQRIEAVSDVPKKMILDAKSLRKTPLSIHFDPENDCMSADGQPIVGLQTSDRLLAILIGAGEFGVPIFRLFDTLWPEEPLSLRTHLKRLEQAAHQLRGRGTELKWANNHLWIAPSTRASAQWSLPKAKIARIPGPPFLSERSHFSRNEVQAHFKISERSAKRLCQTWLGKGLIVREGKGRSTRYRVLRGS